MHDNAEVQNICACLTHVLNSYVRHRPDTDANDLMSALAWLLCEVAVRNEVPRESFIHNLRGVFDTTTLVSHEQRDD